MKTAVMFAGVDALDNPTHRVLSLEVPEVARNVALAEKVFQQRHGRTPDLRQFMLSSSEVFHSDFVLKALLCCAAQVGLYDRYRNTHPEPDFLLGCSLGDMARTVCAGAIPFAEMLIGIDTFGNRGKEIERGCMAQVRVDEPLGQMERLEIAGMGITIAVDQTPRHFLISGSRSSVETWIALAGIRPGYRVRMLHDKPLHSPLMRPAFLEAKEMFPRPDSIRWKTPMFSTVLGKMITTGEELCLDLERNMTGAIPWHQSVSTAVDGLDVGWLTNVGPAPTLLQFAQRIPFKREVALIETAC